MKNEWRSEILVYPQDASRITSLKEDPRVEVHDTIEMQLRDLFKTIHVKVPVTNETLEEFRKETLGGRSIEEYGTWVYFPWRRTLVHLLPKNEFISLRTNRNCYKITPEEQEELGQKTLGLVGLSVGYSVALALALERGFGELRLADFDELDLSNLNRIPSAVHGLGVPKVILAARTLFELDPYLNIEIFPEGLNEKNLEEFFRGGKGLDLVIDECDGFEMKILLRQAAKRHRIPVVMETSDRGLMDVERFDLEPDRPIFHGRLEGIDPKNLRNMNLEQTLSILTRFTDVDGLSLRAKVSLLEVGQSIRTWPQLGSAILHGGGAVADTVRRILLDQAHSSGRYSVDFEKLIMPNEASTYEFETAKLNFVQDARKPEALEKSSAGDVKGRGAA